MAQVPTLPIRRNIKIQRGARKSLSWDIRDADGQLIDVGPARMQIRDQPEGALVLDCTAYIANPSTGLYQLVLEPLQTSALPIDAGGAAWVYDIFHDDTVVGLGTQQWFVGQIIGVPRVTQ